MLLHPTKHTVCESSEAEHRVFSPGVGYYSHCPGEGSFVHGGARVGKLTIMKTVYDLILPPEVNGRVVLEGERDKVIPVEYGQELFRLVPFDQLGDGEIRETLTRPEAGDEDGLDDGHVVHAFSTGIFYARPAPDEAPFVVEGQEIETGKALGLIEVMKTFNHILFAPSGFSRGKIKKILVKDAQEVKKGQALFLVEPG